MYTLCRIPITVLYMVHENLMKHAINADHVQADAASGQRKQHLFQLRIYVIIEQNRYASL
jgi:hypothetical protein